MDDSSPSTLSISLHDSGVLAGLNGFVVVAVTASITVLLGLVIYDPQWVQAGLSAAKGVSFKYLNGYYTYVVVLFMLACIAVAVHPRWGRIPLGDSGEAPEFGNLSWFSMMFGAGIGIGMIGYCVAEPLWHFGANPDLMSAAQVGSGAEPQTEAAIPTAYRYTFLHWGFGAWTCYAVVGLCLAYTSFVRKQLLTMRSTLMPLFGARLNGALGHWIDIFSVVAILLGIGQTIGLGLSNFTAGLFHLTGMDGLMVDGAPTVSALVVALCIIVGCSWVSAISGVGRGIKWLSNLNIGLSWLLIALVMVVGSLAFSLEWLFRGVLDYVIHLPRLSTTVWQAGSEQWQWQIDWSVFYWAWWIAFAPFVGLFLARISKNRTIREFLFAAIIAPSFMCFLWFAVMGGTALDLELHRTSVEPLINTSTSDHLYQLIGLLFDSNWATVVVGLVVVLLLTYLVTSADSAILVMNLIGTGGRPDPAHSVRHSTLWASCLVALIGALLVTGGLQAIKTAMILCAIPFSVIMVLMVVALFKTLIANS